MRAKWSEEATEDPGEEWTEWMFQKGKVIMQRPWGYSVAGPGAGEQQGQEESAGGFYAPCTYSTGSKS